MDAFAIRELQQQYIDLISQHDEQYDRRNDCQQHGDEPAAQAHQEAMTQLGKRAVKVQAEIEELMKPEPSAT
jgi:hypothetical protein